MFGNNENQNRVVVIGGGPGGYVAAIEAAQQGADVTLIEKDKLGGTCVNRGCIPTKALVQTAQLFNDIGRAKEFGITVEGFSLNFDEASKRKRKIVDQLRDGVQYLMRKNKIKVVEGAATIINGGRVKVSGKEETEVSGNNIIIATGSVPSSLPVEGIDGSNVINSDDALEMDSLPKSLVIIGGGVIGLEFAQIFRRLNVAVSVVEMMPQILPAEDSDIAKQLEKSLKREGVDIYTSAAVTRIRSAPDGTKEVIVAWNNATMTLRGDKALVSVGRRPFTDQLGLECLGVAFDKGRILVNEYMETNVKNIYAIGDAVGGIMLAHKAMAEGKCAARNASGMKTRMDYKAVPRCIWTSPEVAAVGLTEGEARKRYETIKTATFPFSANGKAKIIGETQGFVKVISESSHGELLGVHIVGPHATEMIAESVLGLTLEATQAELSETIHAHPTLSEAVMEASLGLDGRSLHI
ncbi:MAG: dihydrolipoyl dehydrogenase [Deltaproteobacteria bacterium]|nr:dihydrolipoyl dehydrogenase [Deltaproteobacteria bacterium]